MKSFFRNYAIWLLLFAACYQFGSWMVEHKPKNKYVWSDAEGYYMYLPAGFIHGTFENYPVRTKIQFFKYPGTEKIFTKYTYGVALLQAPFFGAAWVWRWVQGRDPAVYESYHYGATILMGGCFYGVLGLFFLYKSLRRAVAGKFISRQNEDLPGNKFPGYERWATALTIAALLLGTNLLYYTTRAPLMSHVYSFFLASLLIWLTPGLYEKPAFGRFFAAGTMLGLLFLIRPTNFVMALFPLFYGVNSRSGISERARFLAKHFPKILLAVLPAALLWVPQFCYWHYITGDWLLYSYKKEGFDNWASPPVGKVFFSPLNGWLLYSPLMVFALAGIPLLLRGNRFNSWAVLLIWLISTYAFAAWWCWWFGGAFGHRSYVDLLPVLAFPLCFVFLKMLAARPWLKWSGLALAVILCFYSVRMLLVYQYTWSEMDMNWGRYFSGLREAFFIDE